LSDGAFANAVLGYLRNIQKTKKRLYGKGARDSLEGLREWMIADGYYAEASVDVFIFALQLLADTSDTRRKK
jgi:hypothetical protein